MRAPSQILFAHLALALLGLALSIPNLHARSNELRVSSMFGESMVLQQEFPIRIWGRVSSRAPVKVTLAGQSAKATVDGDQWEVTLPPLKAGGPHQLVIESKGEKVVIEDVMIGEVWLCMGQSNMVFPFGKMHKEEAFNEIAGADLPLVRLKSKTKWRKATGDDNLKTWPITPLYFGRDLHQKLKVPIGLIHAGVGGTEILMYGPREDFEADPECMPYVKLFDQRGANKSRANKGEHPLLITKPKEAKELVYPQK